MVAVKRTHIQTSTGGKIMPTQEKLKQRFNENKCFLCGEDSVGSRYLTGKQNRELTRESKKYNFCRQHKNETPPRLYQ